MIFNYRREHDGAVVLSAIIQDGKACGSFRRERTYYGYGVNACKRLFRLEMTSDGAIFDDPKWRGDY